jgi:hypothetical protein
MQTRILLRSMTNGGNTVAIFLKENAQKRTADENQSSSSQLWAINLCFERRLQSALRAWTRRIGAPALHLTR